MKELLVRIRPISEFPSLYSDKLFGAICFASKELYGEEKLIDMINNFEDNPPFLISSAFPCINYNNDIIYFLPKPIEEVKILEDYKNYIDNYKELNKVRYISKDIFNDWINDRIDTTYLLRNLNKYSIKNGLLYPKDRTLKFTIKSYDIPRNQINRLNNISENVFYFEGNYYRNVSLFFIIRVYDHKYEEWLKSSLEFLRDYRGFGPDICVGKGKFEIDYFSENKLLDIPKDQKRFITLSRYIPSIDEINMFKVRNNVFYSIVTKRGMVSVNKPKKQVHFFSEGSTFPNLKNIYGRILQVHEKSVEYGFAFNVGISHE